jgi:hypothetical protein
VDIEDAIDKLHLEGGILRRKEWEKVIGIDLEDVLAEDWEVVQSIDEDEDEGEDEDEDEDEDEYEDDE